MLNIELIKIPSITSIQAVVKKVNLQKGRTFFEIFQFESKVVTAFAPFLLIVPAYLFNMTSHVSALLAFLLVIVSLVIMVPWLIIPTWFLLLHTKPSSISRKVAYGWLGVIYLATIVWVVIF